MTNAQRIKLRIKLQTKSNPLALRVETTRGEKAAYSADGDAITTNIPPETILFEFLLLLLLLLWPKAAASAALSQLTSCVALLPSPAQPLPNL
jgi:hypothetical protein